MTATGPAHVLEISNLSVSFGVEGGRVNALSGVSFAVPQGKTIALVGESGSGKSALAQAVMGLLPRNGRIDSGAIRFTDPRNGHVTNLAALDPKGPAFRRIRGQSISLVFQEPMSAFSPLHTVGSQIADTLAAHGVAGSLSRATTCAILQLVGIPDPERAIDLYPFELSGGLRQRAMIAAALVARPPLVIADEPTTALDVTIQAQVLELLSQLRHELKLSLLLITHDLGVVAQLADAVCVLYRGRLVEAGPVSEVFARGRHPYFRALHDAVPRIGGTAQAPAAARDLRPMIVFDKVTKRFDARRAGGEATAALSDVSFAVHEGECFGLVGESGSGKSTAAKAIMRALVPDEGSVQVRDTAGGLCDVAQLKGAALKAHRARVQYVFQDPYAALNPRLSVLETVTEPMVIHGIGTPAEQRARAAQLMRDVGLEPSALERYPHAFSGGQRQRIGIARALALDPAILVLDEPTSALDVSVQAQVLDLLNRLKRERNLTYLFISHNLAVVENMANRVAVMCRGRVVEIAPAAALFRDPHHPYTRALMAAIPEPDPARRLNLALLMDGRASDPAQWPKGFALRAGEAGRFARVAEDHDVLMAA
ncbi:MAG TPA: ABC transporter ATP-binding protein [Micropepsaceae bacterium]|nr:ABC transporter ATP-binding protein [Micropepsaceae bacterium]